MSNRVSGFLHQVGTGESMLVLAFVIGLIVGVLMEHLLRHFADSDTVSLILATLRPASRECDRSDSTKPKSLAKGA